MTRKVKRQAKKGFTLAELLIALAILGVIATFTIPKILDSTSSSKTTAIAKEAASLVSGAYTNYKAASSPVSATAAGDLTQYMNYVNSTNSLDMGTTNPNDGSLLEDCAAAAVCLNLHNGAILQYDPTMAFGGTGATNALHFNVDPDGTGLAVGKVTFVQFYNGRMTTGGKAGTFSSSSNANVVAQTTDPTYMSAWN